MIGPQPHLPYAARGALLGVATAALLVAACHDHTSAKSAAAELSARGEATGAATTALPDIAWVTSLPTGPLAGNVIDSARYTIHNPYQGDAAAIQEGQRLFIQMNCAYCHGFDGGGGMGPNLQGRSWRFGGDDADVFKTIFGGRGKGMPAWGVAITQDNIWKIVSYIRTLGAAPAGPTGARVPSPAEAREPMKSINEWEP
jgi:cytochrome c oxidase cbb3-type subunit 3